MILNNYKKIRYALNAVCRPNTSDSTTKIQCPSIKDVSGNEWTYIAPGGYRSSSSNVSGTSNILGPLVHTSTGTSYWTPWVAHVGTGRSVDADDYQLTSDCGSNANIITFSRSVTYDTDTNTEKVICTINAVNNTDSALEIGEFGVSTCVYMGDDSSWTPSSSAGYGTGRRILIIKEVLDEPINVPAHGSFSINFEILNY